MALATEDTNDSVAYSPESVTSPPFIPPFFRCVLTRELASGTISFPINSQFISHHPEIVQYSVIAILQTSRHSEYHSHIYKYQYGVDTTVYLGTGWYYFALLENLREGDILDFHLSVSGIFHCSTYKFHVHNNYKSNLK
ncbi:hypothetical protein ACFE04_000638 [Oxalis oulophora]